MFFLLLKFSFLGLCLYAFSLIWTKGKPLSFAVGLFLGLATLAVPLSVVSCFAGVEYLQWVFTARSFWLIVPLLFVTLMAYINIKHQKVFIEYCKTNYLSLLGLGGAAMWIAYLSAQQSITGDEGAYHAQFITWAQRYPVIPGLGNLSIKLGFNSHWHLLAAALSFEGVLGHAENHLNGLICFAMLTYAWTGARKLWAGGTQLSDIIKTSYLIVAVLPQMLVYHLIDPSADLAAMYLTLIIFTEWLQKIERDELYQFDQTAWLIIGLSCFLLTLKLSAATVGIAAVAMLLPIIDVRKYWLTWVKVVALGALIILPWLYRNVVLTGYPLYPATAFNVFSPDWKMPEADVKHVQTLIKDWAVTLYSEERENVTQQNFIQSRLVWFTKNLRPYDQLLVLLSVISLLGLSLRLYLRRSWQTLFWLGTIAINTGLWFVSAPDPRFAYAVLYLPVLYGIAIIVQTRTLQIKRLFVGASVFGLLSCLALTYLLYSNLKTKFLQKQLFPVAASVNTLLLPSDYPHFPKDSINLSSSADKLLWSAKSQNCWDDCPCTYLKDTLLQARSTQLKDGFSRKAE